MGRRFAPPGIPRRWGIPLLVVGFIVATLGATGVASAAPSEATMSLTDLQSRLDTAPGGTLDGYFKTVLAGTTIETIPVDIVAVTVVGNSSLFGAPPKLIMFDASGPKMTAIGGIASGMSGSPVYLDDPGDAKLVGAVSYGDIFTLNYRGLATPIEYMSAVEADYNVKSTSARLAEPVRTNAGTVSRITISPNAASTRGASAVAGTAVMAPLTEVQVGGLPATGKMFAALRKHMADHGISVRPGAALAGGWDPSIEATLEGGAAVAALASRGDLWIGGAGTITYATADSVVAFGHPMFWEGHTGLTLTNAWVDGVWPSTLSPYKLIAPTKVRGVFTQDRWAGIAGRTDVLPEETPVTARATMVQDGKTATAASYMPRWAMDSSNWMYQGNAMMGAYAALAKALNAGQLAGSAVVTSTVVVTDGTTTYTVVRPNVFDDAYDIAYASVMDVASMVSSFQQLNALDIHKAHITSVDFSASVSTTRSAATIVDVDVPGGLKVGANTVRTYLKVRGVAATQTVDSSLTIPAGMATNGRLTVMSNDQGYSFYDPFMGGVTVSMGDFGMGGYVDPTDKSVSDVVSGLGRMPRNNELQIQYSTGGAGPMRAMSTARAAAAASAPTSVDVTKTTSWYLRGSADKAPAQVSLIAEREILPYAGSVKLQGTVMSASGDVTVTLYARSPGDAAETALVQVVATTTGSNPAQFEYTARNLTKNTTITARVAGDSMSLAGEASVVVHVQARVRLTASPTRVRAGRTVRLRATVSPAQGGATVAFERQVRGRWVRLRHLATTSSGLATYLFRPTRGRHVVRARFLGSTMNEGARSGGVIIRAT